MTYTWSETPDIAICFCDDVRIGSVTFEKEYNGFKKYKVFHGGELIALRSHLESGKSALIAYHEHLPYGQPEPRDPNDPLKFKYGIARKREEWRDKGYGE